MYKNRMIQLLASVALIGIGFLFGTLGPALRSGSEKILSVSTSAITVPAHTKPVDIKAVKMTAIGVEEDIIVPEDGWITSFSPQVEGAPESALRYGWLFDTSQSDPYCTSTQARVVFVMSLEKTPQVEFPAGFGYFVTRGTKLRVMGGFANLTERDFAAASLTVNLTFVPVSSGKKLGTAYPLFLNAECDSLFVLPPNAQNFTKRLKHPFVIPIDGRIVLLGSHAHDFVTEMLLTLNGHELWKTSAVHLPNGTNLGNPVYTAPFNGVPVKKGDTLDLVQKSTNQKNAPAAAMSSMYIQILPSATTTSEDTGGMHM